MIYNLIIESFFKKINNTLNKIENFKESPNLFTMLNIPNIELFKLIVIVIVLFIISNKLDIKLNHIFILIISIIIIYILLNKYYNIDYNNKYNDNIKLKFLNNIMFNKKNITNIDSINELYHANEYDNEKSYLYLNKDVLNFYYNLKKLTIFNMSNFRDSLISSNNLIKYLIESDIKNINSYINFLSAKKEYFNALNSFQSIIYSLPNTDIQNKILNKSLILLNKILYSILNKIKKKTIENNNNKDININTTPESIIKSDNYISPNDTNKHSLSYSYNFF